LTTLYFFTFTELSTAILPYNQFIVLNILNLVTSEFYPVGFCLTEGKRWRVVVLLESLEALELVLEDGKKLKRIVAR